MFYRLELLFQTQTPRLRSQVGVLPAGDFVLVHLGRACAQFRLEGVVIFAHRLPVIAEFIERRQVHFFLARVPFHGRREGVKIGLRGQSRHTCQRHVDDIYARIYGAVVGRALHGGRVVRVQVNRYIDGIFEGGNEDFGGTRFQQPRHVFDAENVCALVFQLLRQIDVILQRKFLSVGLAYVARVADAGLRYSARVAHFADADFHIFHPIQRVENTENVDARFGSLLDKAFD